MEIINDLSIWLGALLCVSFLVNIIVQLTKEFIPLPTKLWCILVAISVNICALSFSTVFGISVNISVIIFSVLSGFIVAYVAMFGFDTLKELWKRFKDCENINEDN